MTPPEWLDIAALWAGLWPNRALPPSSVEPWYELLADLDAGTVGAALRAWALDPDRGWPPNSPGELRAAAAPPARDWTEAIGDLATLVRRHGRVGGRPELDPVLDAYVDSMGGWTALCSRWDATNSTVRAQFRDFYATASTRLARAEIHAIAAGATPALAGPARLPAGATP